MTIFVVIHRVQVAVVSAWCTPEMAAADAVERLATWRVQHPDASAEVFYVQAVALRGES